MERKYPIETIVLFACIPIFIGLFYIDTVNRVVIIPMPSGDLQLTNVQFVNNTTVNATVHNADTLS